ncbi:SRPBCC family protein [Prosthecochloris sp. SCSIO W1101]|uniref:SRPBCC family protein n=1 Tax=Prosthecochloris sp. SCSIO W1101 TaxID=2992242 RepID=UPI00223CFAEE|nr:SRPBCC family protein [Prosthecochloris sp. SCSIO W1101]UZJ40798.1 SRPBCC family protein [Prosthecochloris sp. SCSIO W1101]
MTKKTHLAIIVSVLFLLFFAASATAESPRLNLPSEQTRLLDGETIIFLERDDDDVIDVSGSVYIRSVPETIWTVITDYDNFPDTMPKVKESTVIEDNGNIKIIEQTSKTGVLFFKVKFSTKMTIIETFPDTLSFKLISGDFETFNGKWVLTPHEEYGTFVTWSATVKPDFSAPGFIIDAVQKRDLRELLETIKELSESSKATVSPERETKKTVALSNPEERKNQ